MLELQPERSQGPSLSLSLTFVLPGPLILSPSSPASVREKRRHRRNDRARRETAVRAALSRAKSLYRTHLTCPTMQLPLLLPPRRLPARARAGENSCAHGLSSG